MKYIKLSAAYKQSYENQSQVPLELKIWPVSEATGYK